MLFKLEEAVRMMENEQREYHLHKKILYLYEYKIYSSGAGMVATLSYFFSFDFANAS